MFHQLHSFILATAASLSFGVFSVLALLQNLAEAGHWSTYKDIGMGGAFIATCFFMFRYFTEQVKTKDEAHKELTEQFIKVIQDTVKNSQDHIHRIEEHSQQLAHLVEKVEHLGEKILMLLKEK